MRLVDPLDFIATALESAVAGGEDFDSVLQRLLTDIITEHGAVVFNGDGYSENWQIEAAERGLPDLKTTLDAIPELIKPETVELFERYGVFNERELHSRYEVRLEQYALTIGVEAKLACEIGSTVILPAAILYQTELAHNVATVTAAGFPADTSLPGQVSASIADLTAALARLKAALATHVEGSLAEALHARDELLTAMDAVRAVADTLEGTVADDLWPLPTYQEMLFIL